MSSIARSSSELANISYIRKFIDATFLLAEPKVFIMKKSTTTPMSQNMKNRKRLDDVKSPTAAIWNNTIRRLDILGCSFSGFPDSAVASSTTDDMIKRIRDITLILKVRETPRELM